MKGYNVIIVFNKEKDKILLCERRKDPYKGLINFVGGKIENSEDSRCAAYRELFEETAITEADINLIHLMDYTYHLDNIYLEVWVGALNKHLEPKGDENRLFWSTLDYNFFDMKLYAGEGNMGHMLEHVKMSKDKIFNNTKKS